MNAILSLKKIAGATLVTLMTALAVSLGACSEDTTTPQAPIDVQFFLPGKITIEPGGQYTFDVINSKSPQPADKFILKTAGGEMIENPIGDITAVHFTVTFSPSVVTGSYQVLLRRGDSNKAYGAIGITISTGEPDDPTPDDPDPKDPDDGEIKPLEGCNIYGVVRDQDGPVAGVVMSDGIEVTVTDSRGVYNLASTKRYAQVFMSTPGGYEAHSNGVLPVNWARTSTDPATVERFDFMLNRVNDQDNFTVYFLGDMHLANRNKDLTQFYDLCSDLNTRRASEGGRTYAITLGDMTWDLYWYSNSYQLNDYLTTINSKVKGLQIYHTMGNHDNDMHAFNDLDAEAPYRRFIAPNYYSFNIGKFHFISLDNIDCSAYDGTDSRNNTKFVTQNQLDWLARDLAYVDRSTPIILTSHAPFFRPSTTKAYEYDHSQENTDRLLQLLDGYEVTFVTGHTHQNFAVQRSAAVIGGRHVDEYNLAAVCASWWWSGKLTPGYHLCVDGTPGGYAIWKFNGTRYNMLYKGTGRDVNEQFRCYDLNQVSFSRADVPLMPSTESVTKYYDTVIKAYAANSRNEVLINVWNWNPSWTVKVTTESGTTLPATRVWAYDPLHIAALTVKRFNNATITGKPVGTTEYSYHFFKVTAPDATTDLTITVSDNQGNTWTKKMARPMAFSLEAYK